MKLLLLLTCPVSDSTASYWHLYDVLLCQQSTVEMIRARKHAGSGRVEEVDFVNNCI